MSSSPERVALVVLTQDPQFCSAVSEVAHALEADAFGVSDASHAGTIEPWLLDATHAYLQAHRGAVWPCFVVADSQERAVSELRALSNACVYMLVIDGSHGTSPAADLELEVARFYETLERAEVRWRRNAHSVLIYSREPAVFDGRGYSLRYLNRVRQLGEPVAAGDLLSAVLNVIDLGALNRRAFRPKKPVYIGAQLYAFLSRQGPWDSYYFTGSVVSSLIETIEALRFKEDNAYCITGPNEHSLACGALANHIVHGRQYLLIITSGMADELKGTLANLRDADAKGIVLIAESAEHAWFPFQGTRHRHEDISAVFEARGLTVRYLGDRATYKEDLRAALGHYASCKGPLVLLVRGELLAETGELEGAGALAPPASVPAACRDAEPEPQAWMEVADRVIERLNLQPIHVLFQCGKLSAKAQRMALEVAERTGIALVDSLTRPGSVPHFRDGKRIENVLGGLSLYGFSGDAYRYLHKGEHLRGKDALLLGFLGSKIAQMATPLPEARLHSRATVLQVNRDPEHIAPFTHLACVCDVERFLEYVRDRLRVDPSVLSFRREALARAREPAPELSARIASSPPSPNYFFFRLNALLERLIATRAYRYVGVYDVGRNGISAYRNIVRTDVGFSGWYGRALMGDAWLSLIGLCVNAEGNVLAFIGDGARAMQPDIVPHLVENLNHHRARLRNLTVFIMVNGQLGLISTYQERFLHHRARRQMRVPWTPPPPQSMRAGRYEICYETLAEYSEPLLEKSLLADSRVNIISVACAHNSFADGMTLASLKCWQEAVE